MTGECSGHGNGVFLVQGGAAFTDNRQRVLDASDIVRLVGEHLTLKPKGREYVCLCPFHDDRNPSMYIVPAKQIYHCFVCGAGGNAIDFVMKFHGMPFREALEFLATRAGVELAVVAPGAGGDRKSSGSGGSAGGATREQLLEANAFALRLFRGMLTHQEHGALARELIGKRGISAEMVEAFQIGVAPDRWDGLLKTLESKGIEAGVSAEAGLLKKRDGGAAGGAGNNGFYDTFRNRLMFPISDQIGRVVAFGGRKMRDEDEPKYLNSPETRVFDKGATLFGLKQATRSIQNLRSAIITEGYIDAIACHQAGFTNTVATLGTALTTKHATILRRLCESVTLLFDGDEAGQRAADRALEVFFTEPIDVRIATLPDGGDPDDLLAQEGGAEKFRTMLASARDFLEYRFARLRERLDGRGLTVGTTGRAAAIEAEIDRLVELGLRTLPPVRQQTVVQRLARIAGVDAAAVADALRKRGVGGPGRGGSAAAGGRSETVRAESGRSAVEHAFGCLLLDPILSQTDPDATREIVEAVAYGSPLLKEAAEAVSAALERGSAPTIADLLLELENEDARRSATGLVAEIDRLTEGDHDRVAEHWKQCVRRAKLEEMRSGVGASSPADGESEIGEARGSLHASLERARRQHERLGGNPLALPRPGVGAV